MASLRVPDRVETERRREAAQRQVEAVYDYEPDLVARQTRLLREAYSVLAIEMASIERRRQELQAKLDEGADPGRSVVLTRSTRTVNGFSCRRCGAWASPASGSISMASIRSVTIAPWRMRSARCCTPCTDGRWSPSASW